MKYEYLTVAPKYSNSNHVWYAVMRDRADDDWGTGSYDIDEAVAMLDNYGDEAYIAVIEECSDDNECIAEITREDI